MSEGGCAVSTMTETVSDLDEGLRWATAGGVRVWDYIDKLLEARYEAMQAERRG